MHPLVLVAATATSIVAGIRIAKQINARIKMRDTTAKRAAAENKSGRNAPRNLGALKPDPQTGVYRPDQA